MKPWHQVVVPRPDIRAGKPLDASEFAIHLDQVVGGTAPADYREPQRFFERTFMTQGLREVTVEVMRRLSGETLGASPVINLTTQFGGGKTHALALLYHLFSAGPAALGWRGVRDLCSDAGVEPVRARVATFVGTEFDPVSGRSAPGEPTRLTPWGEIAWQLGGEAGFREVAEQDRLRIRPGGDVLRRMLPGGQPVLILMDEVLNFINAARGLKAGDTSARETTLASQFLSFVQALTVEATGRAGLALVMALPKSSVEMTSEDQSDFTRLQKLSTRVDKPYILSTGSEIAEIIRRRLFEDLGAESERRATARAYARWMAETRDLLPRSFPLEGAAERIEASYPFHPSVLAVFEDKWQSLPAFQRTRGVLRMLALWVGASFMAAYRSGGKEPLITLGDAPLGDSFFRAAVLEQLGESRLEPVVQADIAGAEAHADRLDAEASGALRGLHVHRSVASAVFFESSGGQARNEATLPELRLDLGRPGFELGFVESALSAMAESCYYLTVDQARYRFSLQPNLNKLISDLSAGLSGSDVEDRVREEVQAVLKSGGSLERRWFPERPGDAPNSPTLTLVVLDPGRAFGEQTLAFVGEVLASAGAASRTYKTALFFSAPESPGGMTVAARKALAWQKLAEEAGPRGLGPEQQRQVVDGARKAKGDLRDAVWTAYRKLLFLGPEGVEQIDLGLLTPSAGETLGGLIQSRLAQQDILVDTVSPDFIVRHWPPAHRHWPTRSLRDAFFSSPALPRVTSVGALKTAIVEGVDRGSFGLAAVGAGDAVSGLRYKERLLETDVDFIEDTVLVPAAEAGAIASGAPVDVVNESDGSAAAEPEPRISDGGTGSTARPAVRIGGLRWAGAIPPQKFGLFYSKVLQRIVLSGGLDVRIEFESRPPDGLTPTQANEVRQGLADLELDPSAVEILEPDC